MKQDIHPNYVEAKIKCACGAEYRVMSVKSEIHVGICAKCHPFFTGKQKLMDTEGRVDRFRRKYKQVEVKATPPTAPAATKTA